MSHCVVVGHLAAFVEFLFALGVSPVAVDHVRFYSLREPYACQDDAPDVSVHLDLSKLML